MKSTLPPTYSKDKPQTIPLDKVYVHVGHEKIYFGRGGDIMRGGLTRVPTKDFGPQRDPTERLAWVQKQVEGFKPNLFREPVHLSKDENGEYSDTDGGGRALMAHILGHPTIEAFVVEGETLKDRAQAFLDMSKRGVPLKAVQVFLTHVAAGDNRQVCILRAIQPFYTVRENGSDAIRSVAALYGIYDFANGAPEDKNAPNPAGIRLLQRTAEECHLAWGPQEGRKRHDVDGVMFVAVALVVQALPPKTDMKRFRRWLAAHSPSDIDSVTRDDLNSLAMRSASKSPQAAFKLLSLDMPVPLATVIARGYNKGLKKDSHIPMDEITSCDLAVNYAKTRQSRHVV